MTKFGFPETFVFQMNFVMHIDGTSTFRLLFYNYKFTSVP